jgi:hypothetical protein
LVPHHPGQPSTILRCSAHRLYPHLAEPQVTPGRCSTDESTQMSQLNLARWVMEAATVPE